MQMSQVSTEDKQLISKFYEAFHNRDYQTMQNCYHDDLIFYDPVFKQLNSCEAKAMWKMLCERGKDLVISYSNVQEKNSVITCNWEAVYTFSKTGRRVHNKILATFSLKDGKIHTHKDHFNFWKWATMALGFSGFILGWTQFFQDKVSASALKTLKQYTKKVRQHLRCIFNTKKFIMMLKSLLILF